MARPTLPQRPKVGKLARTNRIVEIIDYLSALDESGPISEFGHVHFEGTATFFAFHGIVTDAGPPLPAVPPATEGPQADFIDNRYWVIRANAKPKGSVTNDSFFYSPFVINAKNVVMATNVGEPVFEGVPPPSHSVDTGTPVQVFGTLTGLGTRARLKYWFKVDRMCHFPVSLDVNAGGTDGSNISAANYTYDVYSPAGSRLIKEGASPEWPRPFGAIVPATKGVGYFDSFSGQFVLWQAAEAYETISCGT